MSLVITSINQLCSLSLEDIARRQFQTLTQYQIANYRAVSRFAKAYKSLFLRTTHDIAFNLFLDDACVDLQDSVAFSPPHSRGNIAIVDPITINAHFYLSELSEIHKIYKSYSHRADMAYWRGAMTGLCDVDPHIEKDNYIDTILTNLPRVALARLSISNPGLLDAKITSCNQWLYEETIELKLQDEKILTPHDPFAANFNHKYLIDIDGNSNSWPGFFMKLGSGSCVIKVESPNGFYQWYYKYLSPWKHYVPVGSSSEDLIEKISYLQRNQEKAEAIANNSLEFIFSKTALEWAMLAASDFSLALKMKS